MSFNFPNSPLQGALYTPPGGYQYVYLDGVWRVVESPQDVGTAQARNRVVNGAMQISQENGNTASTAGSYYAADQWFTIHSSTATITNQRVVAYTPNGSVNRYRVTITAADAALAAGDYLCIRQMMEGTRIADFKYGTAQARQTVLRFGFKGPAGTYSFRILEFTSTNRTHVQNFTISAAQANIDTEQVFVIPGETLGTTWSIGPAAASYFDIVLACGTTYQAPATGWSAGAFQGTSANTNGMATAGDVFELYDVGLYLDPLATGVAPRWVMPDEAQELAACQRYWERGNVSIRWDQSTGVGWVVGFQQFYVTKRIVPAVATLTSTLSGFGAPVYSMATTTECMLEGNVSAVGPVARSITATTGINARM